MVVRLTKIFWLLLLLVPVLVKGQKIGEELEDIVWAHNNANINAFFGAGAPSVLLGGLNNEYVYDKLELNSSVFHDYQTFFIEANSELDFRTTHNQKHYSYLFESGDSANFAQVMMYYGKKNRAFSRDMVSRIPIFYDQIDSISDRHNLQNASRFILNEYWFFNKNEARMDSYIRWIGVYSETEKIDTPIVWIDLTFFDQSIFDRVRIKKEDGSVLTFTNFLKNKPTYQTDFNWQYSRCYNQKRYDVFNNELDANFELNVFKHTLKAQMQTKQPKEGKPFKTKQLFGKLVNGLPEGKWLVKGKKGKLRAEFTFVNGLATGGYKLFYSSGEIKETGTFLNNRKNGLVTNYYSNGSTKSTKNYENGFPAQTHKTFFENGKPHSVVPFNSGVPFGEYVEYNTNGTKKVSGRFYKGYIVGEWKYNLALNGMMCGFLEDEIPYVLDYHRIDPDCVKDCTISFSYMFHHQKPCSTEVCIDPELISDFK